MERFAKSKKQRDRHDIKADVVPQGSNQLVLRRDSLSQLSFRSEPLLTITRYESTSSAMHST